MLFTVAAINKFIDHALTAGHSIDEMNKLMQSAGVGGNPGLDFDYKEEMWHLSNPFTCLHHSVKAMEQNSVFTTLISGRKKNYYAFVKNLTNELAHTVNPNLAVKQPTLNILSSISLLDYSDFRQEINFSGDYSIECESVIYFILWNLNNNSQLKGPVYENLIEIVCRYYLEIKSYESPDTGKKMSRLFTLFGSQEHQLEHCVRRIVTHITSLFSSKDLKRRNRFNYEDYWNLFYIFHSLRRNIGKAPINLFISLKNNLDKRARTNDTWYTELDMPNESPIPFQWQEYDRFWMPNLREEFWDHNMNIHPPVDHISLHTIVNYVMANNRREAMEFLGTLICKGLTNKIRRFT